MGILDVSQSITGLLNDPLLGGLTMLTVLTIAIIGGILYLYVNWNKK